MSDPIRVQKAIARAGLMSRRAAEEAIVAGRVTIGGTTAVLGDRVNPDNADLALDGVPVPTNPGLETHLLYKPVGVISTASDPHGRQTVVDLVPTAVRLFPVGRLDADSEGLLLLTNDGTLANHVTHPRYGVSKTYLVLVRGKVTPRVTHRLVEGISLDDGPAKATAARVVERHGDLSQIEITMGEGRNREIRRMMAALGLEVLRLVRTAIGPITDSNLSPGESRRLEPEEVYQLLASATG